VHGLVAKAHMLGARIGIGIHGDGLDGHAPCGSSYPAGYFTAIGDKDFFKHR
jgi:hypothetical protein